jgi:hypothetical protein
MHGSGSAFRVLCVVLGFYFVFATVVQVNDPDAGVWESIYAIATAVTFFAAWRMPPRWVPLVVAAIAGVWALTLAPDAFESSFRELFQTWQMMSPAMEVGREFLGLLILTAWMLVLAARRR